MRNLKSAGEEPAWDMEGLGPGNCRVNSLNSDRKKLVGFTGIFIFQTHFS